MKTPHECSADVLRAYHATDPSGAWDAIADVINDRDASLRAEADEAWRALEDIGYEHHDGKRYSTVNGEFCCGVCLRPVSMCDRRCAGKGEDWCAGHIARAALRTRVMP